MASPPIRFVVLGESGMAGHVISTYLREAGHNVVGLAARTKLNKDTYQVDVLNHGALVAFLRAHPADVVINCIGTLVEESAEHPDRAAYINGYLPHFLEAEFRPGPTRVFHLSTDCVFSGARGDYEEGALRDGSSFYDRSKALGELENTKDLTVRTSIIGPEIRSTTSGLLDWFLNIDGQIHGFQQSIWNGLTTLELARQIEILAMLPDVTGVVHPAPTGVVTKDELLRLMRSVFGRESVEIQSVPGKRADKTLRSTRTDYRGPAKTHLEMLMELRNWMLAHPQLYRELAWFQALKQSPSA